MTIIWEVYVFHMDLQAMDYDYGKFRSWIFICDMDYAIFSRNIILPIICVYGF